jgi:hypothetical protein
MIRSTPALGRWGYWTAQSTLHFSVEMLEERRNPYSVPISPSRSRNRPSFCFPSSSATAWLKQQDWKQGAQQRRQDGRASEAKRRGDGCEREEDVEGERGKKSKDKKKEAKGKKKRSQVGQVIVVNIVVRKSQLCSVQLPRGD